MHYNGSHISSWNWLNEIWDSIMLMCLSNARWPSKHYRGTDLMVVIFLHKCTFGLNFPPHEISRQNSVNKKLSNKTAWIAINFANMATFSTSHICHMWRISDFSTSVIWTHLKFLHMWKYFQFPHKCHTWKAEIFPQDNFFSKKLIRDFRDKYQVCMRDII